MRANTLRLALATAAFVFVATDASAGWQDVASKADQQRLASLGDAKQKGLAEAHAGAGAGDYLFQLLDQRRVRLGERGERAEHRLDDFRQQHRADDEQGHEEQAEPSPVGPASA